MKPEGREVIISRFWSVIEQMSIEIGYNIIAAPDEKIPDLCKQERDRWTWRENYCMVFRRYNTVAEEERSPQRLQGRQLTFELSQALPKSCLTLASFKCLTLPEPWFAAVGAYFELCLLSSVIHHSYPVVSAPARLSSVWSPPARGCCWW